MRYNFEPERFRRSLDSALDNSIIQALHVKQSFLAELQNKSFAAGQLPQDYSNHCYRAMLLFVSQNMLLKALKQQDLDTIHIIQAAHEVPDDGQQCLAKDPIPACPCNFSPDVAVKDMFVSSFKNDQQIIMQNLTLSPSASNSQGWRQIISDEYMAINLLNTGYDRNIFQASTEAISMFNVSCHLEKLAAETAYDDPKRSAIYNAMAETSCDYFSVFPLGAYRDKMAIKPVGRAIAHENKLHILSLRTKYKNDFTWSNN